VYRFLGFHVYLGDGKKVRREDIVTKRIKTGILAVALGVLGALSAPAQLVSAVKANIPFDFVIADHKHPAGEYWFVQSRGSAVLRIYSTQMKSTTLEQSLLTYQLPLTMDTRGPGYLLFHTYGSQRFLHTIRDGAVSFGAALPTSRAENEYVRSRMVTMLKVAVR
jgi:hypothetical protein